MRLAWEADRPVLNAVSRPWASAAGSHRRGGPCVASLTLCTKLTVRRAIHGLVLSCWAGGACCTVDSEIPKVALAVHRLKAACVRNCIGRAGHATAAVGKREGVGGAHRARGI